MTGEHEFAPGFGPPGRHSMEFRITWGPRDLREWLNPLSERFLSQPLAGTITIDGLCRDVPCHGTLDLRYFTERAIRYTIEFEVEGTRYRYIGEKVGMWPWNLHRTHTTCYGRLTRLDTGEVVSTSITYFPLRALPAFFRSLRLSHDDSPPLAPDLENPSSRDRQSPDASAAELA